MAETCERCGAETGHIYGTKQNTRIALCRQCLKKYYKTEPCSRLHQRGGLCSMCGEHGFVVNLETGL